MNGSEVAVVWNPSKLERADLEAALAEAGLAGPAVWHETSENDAGQGATRTALAGGARAVLVAGGDGTVRAVLEAVAEAPRQVPVGIIPSGTGNLLARNLGLPINDDVAACRIALGESERRIDLGWVEVDGDRHAFAIIAGFGVDSRMIAETDDDLKSKTGWLAYVAALGKAVSSADIVDVKLSVDDGEATSLAAHTVIVGNFGTVQGGVTLLPDAEPDDGVLDALILSADSIVGWLDTLKSAVWDNGVMRWFQKDAEAEGTASTDHLRGVRFEIAVEKPVTFQVDGDELGDVSRIMIEVQESAVAVRG